MQHIFQCSAKLTSLNRIYEKQYNYNKQINLLKCAKEALLTSKSYNITDF